MARKSVGGSSAPGTPAGARKTAPGTPSAATDAETTSAGLSVPAGTKLVLKQQEAALKGIEAYELPRSNIIRCAKTDIPDTVQLRKDTQHALVRAATVFISYLTASAHDTATAGKAKTIAAQHVLSALKESGLMGEEDLVELRGELKAYRDAVVRKKSEKANSAKPVEGEEGEGEGEGEENDADVSRMDGGDDDDSRIDAADASAIRSGLHGAAPADDQLMDED
ncbi:related to dna polymerase epsilon p17 subunit [Sporisorium reilianum SRZ2]|uniref:DNA polymerase epsilon subunit D n=1 Tax=Sporisorium reilianum (strain SRZ2) TaxID=999809 RepID=E7A2I8_SPORE|nr:related to dna polymerase epsilon p17 subunit [Sporisorium reilianum SRZ2]